MSGHEAYLALSVVHLYPREMDVNGDRGNLLVLLRRMQWRDIQVELTQYRPGDPFPHKADLLICGGGQIKTPSDQPVVLQDLPRIKEPLRTCIEAGAAALCVCGGYQLFCNSITTAEGESVDGLGIFEAHTTVGEKRFTGNVVAEGEGFGTIVGFENHNGRTYLHGDQAPLARILVGAGNNGEDKTEGAWHHHALGTYLSGPLLPKNPAIADYLIAKALEHRLGRSVDPSELAPLPIDAYAAQAADIARTRPR
jgi:CobQ-like glutamine amidotransferase family enzyme